MSGVVELGDLLKHMAPSLDPADYTFCTVQGGVADYVQLDPLCTFVEAEGLTLILTVASAEQAQLQFEGTYKRIALTVHSSLDAVGLTAAVSAKLTAAGISANVVAAYYHDHVFVQSQHAAKAMESLSSLIESHRQS